MNIKALSLHFLKRLPFSWNSSTAKKVGMWISIIFLILGTFFFLRGCFRTEPGRKHVYLIARDSSWYPLELLGRERNLVAFTNDLMEKIASELHIRFEWVETGSGTLLDGLDNNYYDAILSSMRPSMVNQEKYEFSELIFETGPVLIVREESPMSSLKDLQKKTIGMRLGSQVTFNAIREEGFNVYNFTLVNYTNINKALEALMNDHIDGVFTEALSAYTLSQGFYAGKIKIITPPLTDEGLRIVTLALASSKELIGEIDSVLDSLKENGTYESLIKKWNLIDAHQAFWRPPSKETDK